MLISLVMKYSFEEPTKQLTPAEVPVLNKAKSCSKKWCMISERGKEGSQFSI
jgi:hypothetical protein